eukprot:gene13381-19228_t
MDDVWDDDSDGGIDRRDPMAFDSEARHRQLYNAAGKNGGSMQQGFNQGFVEGLRYGFRLGAVQGAMKALVALESDLNWSSADALKLQQLSARISEMPAADDITHVKKHLLGPAGCGTPAPGGCGQEACCSKTATPLTSEDVSLKIAEELKALGFDPGPLAHGHEMTPLCQ